MYKHKYLSDNEKYNFMNYEAMFVNSFQPYANYCFSFIFSPIFLLWVWIFCVGSRHTEDKATVAIQLHFCNQTAMWPDNVQLVTWPEQTDRGTDRQTQNMVDIYTIYNGVAYGWHYIYCINLWPFSFQLNFSARRQLFEQNLVLATAAATVVVLSL